MRTCAYLVAGHVVILLDDINLVQEAGRKTGSRVTTCSCHFVHPLLPLCKDQLTEMITPQFHGVKSVGILCVFTKLMISSLCFKEVRAKII